MINTYQNLPDFQSCRSHALAVTLSRIVIEEYSLECVSKATYRPLHRVLCQCSYYSVSQGHKDPQHLETKHILVPLRHCGEPSFDTIACSNNAQF